MKNADRPAYPIVITEEEAITGLTKIGKYDGLTKREYFAAMAMQGLLVNMGRNGFNSVDRIAEESIKSADALLERLNNE